MEVLYQLSYVGTSPHRNAEATGVLPAARVGTAALPAI